MLPDPSWYRSPITSGRPPSTALARNAVTLSFCHVARSSRTAIAILVSKRMTAVWQPGAGGPATWAAFRGRGSPAAEAAGSGGHGQLAGAVLALGGGHRDVGRLAVGARSGGRRGAEDGPAAPLHVRAVRDHDEEIDDGHEDDEVDHRADERAEVDALPVEGPAESL